MISELEKQRSIEEEKQKVLEEYEASLQPVKSGQQKRRERRAIKRFANKLTSKYLKI